MNNSKKITSVFTLSMLFGNIIFSDSTKIVTVSGQKVMSESETGKAMQIRLQGEQQKLAEPLKKDEEKLRSKEQNLLKIKESLDKDAAEFEKTSKTLSGDAKSAKLESLQERAVKLEDEKRELDRMVQKLQMEARKVEAKMSELYQKEMIKSDSTKIVTVSGQKVMSESETGKAMQIRLQGEQQKLAEPLKKDEEKLRAKEQNLLKTKESLDKDAAEFEKTSKTLSNDARSAKLESLQERAVKLEDEKRELDRLVQKLQMEARKVEAKMSELYQKEMVKFESLTKETIKELAQKNNWDVVLMEEATVYSNPAISKTKELKTALDEKAKAVNQAKKQALESTKRS